MVHRRLLVGTGLALAAGAVAWALTGLPGGPAACLPAGCDCEAPGPGPIRQPANAWSSLALTVAGVLVAGRGSREGDPSPPAAPGRFLETARAIAAGALVAGGLGAFLYHAGLTAWAARLDGILVAALVGALALSAGARAIAVMCRGEGRREGTGRRIPWRRLPAWALLALGAAGWWLGRSGGVWCRPDSPWQAHAAWHILAAAGIGLWLGPGPGRPQSPAPSSLRGPEASRP